MTLELLISELDKLSACYEKGGLNPAFYVKGLCHVKKLVSLYSDIQSNPGKYYDTLISIFGSKERFFNSVGGFAGVIGRYAPSSLIISSLPSYVIKELDNVISEPVLKELCLSVKDKLGISSKIMDYFKDRDVKQPLLRNWVMNNVSGKRSRLTIPVFGEMIDYFSSAGFEDTGRFREYSYLCGIKQIADVLYSSYSRPEAEKWKPVIHAFTNDLVNNVLFEVNSFLGVK